MNGESYLLVHRFPDGSIHCNTKPIHGRRKTAAVAGELLHRHTREERAVTDSFAVALARQPDGTIWGHGAGHDFRILLPDYTSDGVAITPGLRVFNDHDREWGIIEPLQFMDQGLFSPGVPGFDGYYLFQKDGDNYATKKFHGERLTAKGPLQ